MIWAFTIGFLAGLVWGLMILPLLTRMIVRRLYRKVPGADKDIAKWESVHDR